MGRPYYPATFDLHIRFTGQGVRWPLRSNDEVEVWRGMQHVGTISGHLLLQVLGHYLLTVDLHALLGTLNLRGEVANGLLQMHSPPLPEPDRKPLARVEPFTPEQRAAHRARRKAKKR